VTNRGFDLGSALDTLHPPRATGLPTPLPVRVRRRFPDGCGTTQALADWTAARAARAATSIRDQAQEG
jgi:hypothetical protein